MAENLSVDLVLAPRAGQLAHSFRIRIATTSILSMFDKVASRRAIATDPDCPHSHSI